MSTRTRLSAEYLYPGSFFSESTFVEVPSADWDTLVGLGPREEGYFKRDGWFAVQVREIVEKRFVADDGEETWVRQGEAKIVASFVVGVLKHVDDIPDVDPETGRDQTILKSNIRGNSRDPLKGYGVLTRCGNWQIASDYREVRQP